MNGFFERLPLEAAEQLEQLSRLGFELRENRRQVLQQHGADSEDALLELIRKGAVAEHPGYDHYLGARALAAAREAVRSQLQSVMAELEGAGGETGGPAMLHSALKDAIEREFTAGVVESVELCRDALLVRLHNEVTIELRIAGAKAYSIAWRWGDAELRIDTAPLHRQLATFPNHLHDSDGQLRADPLTDPENDPWDNVRIAIAALLEDPLLRKAEGSVATDPARVDGTGPTAAP